MNKERIVDIIDAKFNEWDIKSPNAKQVAYECSILTECFCPLLPNPCYRIVLFFAGWLNEI